jgi:5-methylcytosine-specific restriction endonuclease McrA
MPNDPFYKSAAWRLVCEAVRQRSRGVCETPGCRAPGKVFDHIKSRRAGGADDPSNVRHLCRRCDNQVKEGPHGKRKSGGTPRAIGCDATGAPRDPSHWWNT